MDADTILTQLEKYESKLLIKTGSGVEIAPPHILGENIVKIRMLLIQLVDCVAKAERDYKHSKASKYDELIKEGVKRSPAFDLLKLDKDLIDKEITAERIRGYMKYIDSLVSSVQSHIKVQTGIANTNL